jgi:uncharacterized membrane protein YfbV (UPF0208 family)
MDIEALFSWLIAAPQGAIALLTAVSTAMVAILVVFLTQWILGRRARTELLTNKLEELYLALNEVSTHSVSGKWFTFVRNEAAHAKRCISRCSGRDGGRANPK